MRVLIDAHMLGHRETGNETYVSGLISGLATIAGVEVAAALEPEAAAAATLPASVTALHLSARGNWHRLYSGFAALCRRWNADIAHATYIAPHGAPCPMVVSVHDVSFRRFPEFFSLRDRALFRALLPGSLRRAAGILALSTHARAEIAAFYPGSRDKIHVVPAAHGERFRPLGEADVNAIVGRLGLRRPFFLAVGSLQPRKNLLRLVEAFDLLRARHSSLDLVIVGPGGFRESRVRDAIVARSLSSAVHWLGYVNDDDLVGLYNAAVALVYPSVYEGFGLPVIEAMACGCPVVAADTSSLPEVAGDAALLVDPYLVASLSDAMDRVVTQPELARSLSRRGLAQAERFTWRRSADAAVEAYRTCLHGRTPARRSS